MSLRSTARAARRVGWRVGCWRARGPRPIGSRPPLYLAVCAIFRDEAPHLAEWVTFHRLQGVERFWLYDNLSRDDWQIALAPELQNGIVEVTPWPSDPGQYSAYSDCLKRHRDDARWIAFIDLDEFLFSPDGLLLPDVLRTYDIHPAVAVNWLTFGTSGHETRPEGLVIERFRWRVHVDRRVNQHVKSIVYPRRASTWVQNSHMFRLYGTAVGEDRRPVHGAFRAPATTNVLRINHYYSRSVAEMAVKFKRSGVAGEGYRRAEWLRHYFADALEERDGLILPVDEIRDETIIRFVPAVKSELARRRC
jgi:hypothetical protein